MNRYQQDKPLLILAGPTAVGKSDISVKVAKALGGECISADSIQVYKGLTIGSGKITEEEMEGVPHHLLDILNPEEDYNASAFQRMAREKVEEIYRRESLPILVGGTGFYIQAMLRDIDFQILYRPKKFIRITVKELCVPWSIFIFIKVRYRSIIGRRRKKRYFMTAFFWFSIVIEKTYMRALTLEWRRCFRMALFRKWKLFTKRAIRSILRDLRESDTGSFSLIFGENAVLVSAKP